MKIFISTLFLLILFTVPSVAQEPAKKPAPKAGPPAPITTQLFFPLACTLGTDCWTVNYTDADPASGAAKDFTCGGKTYDGDKGTDYGFKNFAAVKKGIDVFAAANGKVLRVRDGESDGEKTKEQLDDVRAAKRECGNAVLIDHGHGLQTLYCHLLGGTITVKPGSAVAQGQKIAQAGQSGDAEFPQLHFGVVHDNQIVDPYSGRIPDSTCNTSAEARDALWSLGLPMNYEPLSLFDAEFYNGTPDFDAIKKQDVIPDFIPPDATALSFWAGIYGAQKSDLISLVIIAPDGKEFARSDVIQESNQQRQYYFTGRSDIKALNAGIYKATATLKHGDQSQMIIRTIEVH